MLLSSPHGKKFGGDSIVKKDEAEKNNDEQRRNVESKGEEPAILEEIDLEEFSIDGICGVY